MHEPGLDSKNGLFLMLALNFVCNLHREINVAANTFANEDGSSVPSSFIHESHLAASVAKEIAKLRSQFAVLEGQLRQQGQPDSLSVFEGKPSSVSPFTAPLAVGSPQRQIQVLERLLRQVTVSRNELAVSRDALSVTKAELEAENRELVVRCEALQGEIVGGACQMEEELMKMRSTDIEQVRVTNAMCSFPN